MVDTSKHLNRVLAIDPEARTAIVQPGVVHAALQRAVAPHGLRFGPDPSTHTRCTIGGMIGNNACGSRALGYGRTADNVAGMRVLLGDGSVDLDPGAGPTRRRGRRAGRPGRRAPRAPAHRVRPVRPAGVAATRCEHLLPERGRRLDRFLVGSEGTLGVVLDATVRLVAGRRRDGALVVLGYPSMPEAADAVPALLARPDGLVACEGLDSRIVDVVRAAGRAVPALPRGDGWLFVEVAGDDRRRGRRAGRGPGRRGRCPGQPASSPTPPRPRALWRIREDGAGLAARSLTHARRTPAGRTPRSRPSGSAPTCATSTSCCAEHGLDGVPYGHFGDGCVHVRIDFGFADPAGRGASGAFLERRRDLRCVAHGGSLSGEHGDGRARSELLPLMYDAGVARGCSPRSRRSATPTTCSTRECWSTRRRWTPTCARSRPRAAGAAPRCGWPHDGGSLGDAVHRCTGVGKCLADNTDRAA